MTSHEDEPGLFFLAAILVGLVVVWFMGRAWFRPRIRRPPRRLLVIALASLVPPATTLHHATWRSEGEAGWSSPYMPSHPLTARHAFLRT